MVSQAVFQAVFQAKIFASRSGPQSREVVIREVQEHDHGSAILDFDQLNYLRREGLIFRGYSESEITFPPTYKVIH